MTASYALQDPVHVICFEIRPGLLDVCALIFRCTGVLVGAWATLLGRICAHVVELSMNRPALAAFVCSVVALAMELSA